MRVAIVTESFLPTLNGVTTTVVQVLEHLRRHGHEAMLIAPNAGAPAEYAGFPVRTVPAVPYRQFPVALPSPWLSNLLGTFSPDVVHVASPFMLGAQAIAWAARTGAPSVAIYQTDIPGYARRNHLAAASNLAWKVVGRIHEAADVTLAPSTPAIEDLHRAGVQRVERWGRGVDLERYHPNRRAGAAVKALRDQLAPHGETIVGYVGRLAPEKSVERFAELHRLSGIRLAIVGDGPSAPSVRRALDGMPVSYLGALRGDALADAYAAFDVFAHTGTEETFGQTVQEAHATGLPVVAPRAGGPIDLVTTGEDGILFDPRSHGSLRRAVAELVDDPRARARMGEAGRRRILGRSWDAVCGDLVGHYRRLVDDRAIADISISS